MRRRIITSEFMSAGDVGLTWLAASTGSRGQGPAPAHPAPRTAETVAAATSCHEYEQS